MPIDTITCVDCVEYMKDVPDNSVDLVMTSPPYAKQRKETYGGVSENDYPEWIFNISQEIYRILKPTGSFVLNIKENVNHGERSTYVINSVLKIASLLRWTDTYIWQKTNPFPTGSKKRLKDGFEYCYWFTKTQSYKFNPLAVLQRSNSKWLESEKRRKNIGEHPVRNGSGMNMSQRYVSDMVRPSNVIPLAVDTTNHLHPATFPIGLPEFFIKLMTDEQDVVFDPFAGSGTTAVAAQKLHRHYLGCDIIQEYVDIALNRLSVS